MMMRISLLRLKVSFYILSVSYRSLYDSNVDISCSGDLDDEGSGNSFPTSDKYDSFLRNYSTPQYSVFRFA